MNEEDEFDRMFKRTWGFMAAVWLMVILVLGTVGAIVVMGAVKLYQVWF